MNRILSAGGAVLMLAAAACAPATPTVDPAQIQASAMAAASTMIAMTQEAIPTATWTPEPSPTPLPSPTFPPLPTAPPAPLPSPTAAGGDDCNHIFDLSADTGRRSPVKINNNTKGPANLSLSMNQKNAFGQCGWLGFNIPRGQSITVQMPQTGKGPCWYGYAWINGPDPSTAEGGAFCWNNTDKWTLDIGADVIKLTPP
jgi:hypothetical protein